MKKTFKNILCWLLDHVIRPKWVVVHPDNELALRIFSINLIYYKDATPIHYGSAEHHWRPVFNKEFGHTIHPVRMPSHNPVEGPIFENEDVTLVRTKNGLSIDTGYSCTHIDNDKMKLIFERYFQFENPSPNSVIMRERFPQKTA